MEPPARESPVNPTARLAWLFDVDGTLLLTEGAAREAILEAVRPFIDVEIFSEAIRKAGQFKQTLALGFGYKFN